MSESSTSSPAEGDEWANFDVRRFARQAVELHEETGWIEHMLENRIISLEEIVAARWPRRALLRRRLARELRASVAGYTDDHILRGDFRGRPRSLFLVEQPRDGPRQDRADRLAACRRVRPQPHLEFLRGPPGDRCALMAIGLADGCRVHGSPLRSGNTTLPESW